MDPYVARAFEDPLVAAAHARGRSHTVYELLTKRRNASSDTAERAALDEFLRRRRSFVQPGTPGGMGSINGIGVKLYGSEERDPDGTFIATLYIVFLFIPVFPLSEYLVRPTASGFMRSSWQIFGKVPMSRRSRLWQKASVGLGLAVASVLVVVGVATAVEKQRSADVYVTNDLDIGVSVLVGKASTKVLPHSFASLKKTPKGKQHVVIRRDDGRVIEEEDVTIQGGASATVVNVLAASPVFEEKVYYATKGTAPASEPHLFVGERFVVVDPADYVFVDPPSKINMSDSSGTVAKIHVDRAKEGLEVMLGYLAQNDPARLSELERAMALAEPEVEKMTGRAIDSFDKPDEQLGFIDQLIALLPNDTDLHRRRQNVMTLVGKSADALAEYKERYLADPTNVTNAYLYAALLPRGEGRALLEKVVVDHPRDPYVLRLLGAIAFQEGRFEDAVRFLTKLEKEPRQHRVVLSEHAASLVAARGPLAALTVLERLTQEERNEPLYWVVYGQVVERARARSIDVSGHDPTKVVPKTTTPDDWAMLYMQWGVEPKPGDALDVATKTASDIGLAARRDPTRALDLFDKAAPQAKQRVLAIPALCLAIEAGRLKNESLARAAYAVTEAMFGKDGPLEAFVVSGEDSDVLDGEPMAVRAAVELGRARREPDKTKRKVIEDRARGDDPLIGVVTDALQFWPPP